MNDLAMQGSAAIGIGVFTPWLASGSFESIAVVCVGAAAIGILGDLGPRGPLPQGTLSRVGSAWLPRPRESSTSVAAPVRVNAPLPRPSL